MEYLNCGLDGKNGADSLIFSSDSVVTAIRERSLKKEPHQRRVGYVHSSEYVENCDKLPKVASRVCYIIPTVACWAASLVHGLIEAYGLLDSVRIISPIAACRQDLEMFHSSDYLECLSRLSRLDDDDEDDDEEQQAIEFGLSYDCPAYSGVYECVSLVAGASLAAADSLISGQTDLAINWNGGWHHARRDEASGFCYINDIVLSILRLRQKYERVLYVDLDLHHGDGVENAFCGTDKVMTVSFHKQCPGFFPGTGELSDVGVGKGRCYSVNVPLKDGIDDDMFIDIFYRVMSAAVAVFKPLSFVCQCGADGLIGDPHSCFNLTPRALEHSVRYLISFNLPLLLLGGGGYTFANVARCWTRLTALVLGQTLASDIPEHEQFTEYGPDYVLDIKAGNMPNTNNKNEIDQIVATVISNLNHINLHLN